MVLGVEQLKKRAIAFLPLSRLLMLVILLLVDIPLFSFDVLVHEALLPKDYVIRKDFVILLVELKQLCKLRL